ncbi:conserved Plasmodium protein, unknown function [Babesia microti strain RI]|uniref:Uncharacterized protein n=1 Tax=Babesia microti (strain RI) TaxID=1133968 RepID=A0A1N6LX09_BABMR|nr:conserved Plasmodium protein, unknown function [Babesia microti strain RI]SIO73403.1 conserved Plasmodium protein, unknown function [Babesia microti strain RI]|eukprot:XP_021337504.1 conserved Plasmodium protein, unknown function [Babesia microti strain RI]
MYTASVRSGFVVGLYNGMIIVLAVSFSLFLIGGYSYLFIIFGKFTKSGIKTDFTVISKAKISFSILNLFTYLYDLGYAIKRKLFGYNMLCNMEYYIKNQKNLLKSGDYRFVDSKTIFYVRHGQSMTNQATTNFYTNPFKGFKEILTFIAIETFLIFSSHTIFFDSPLSLLGINQCDMLRSFIFNNSDEQKDDLDIIINSSTEDIAWFVSDLRRAQTTLILSFYDRLKDKKDKIYTDQNLSECTLNPDCISISPVGSCMKKNMSLIDRETVGTKVNEIMENFVENNFDFEKQNYMDILTKMNNFNDRIFSMSANNIVIAGHSRWLRMYMNLFLEPDKPDILKEKKIQNCSLIKYKLERFETKSGNHIYFIKPDSQKFIYGTIVNEK